MAATLTQWLGVLGEYNYASYLEDMSLTEPRVCSIDHQPRLTSPTAPPVPTSSPSSNAAYRTLKYCFLDTVCHRSMPSFDVCYPRAQSVNNSIISSFKSTRKNELSARVAGCPCPRASDQKHCEALLASECFKDD